MTLTRPNSEAHEMLTWFGTVGEMRHSCVMLTGRLGRFGSTPGLLVGIGFYDVKKWQDIQENELQRQVAGIW